MERSAANAEGTDGGGGDSDEGYRAVDDSLEINPSTDAELLAASTPLLHVTTRSQDSLGGGNVSLEDHYPLCRKCATCRAPDCQTYSTVVVICARMGDHYSANFESHVRAGVNS